ncbi:single-stranded DNA-binding protein [Colwellia echini]|uniref:Plasmid-derived single-stranded DNA-binding protein n=1 Tax=Colwellia echini TaxID=1982103 RepID=A0ABY3MZM4_9GAMM|nr:single-stranded DNA-binding protein [Colwellia echini]TYK66690.1 single-stranded DNA-binding protein [Colwellia echini]
MSLSDAVSKHSVTPKPQLCAVTLLGNLVATPDIRYKANPATAITEIVLATSSKWLDKSTNTYKEWTSYHHVKVEGDLVEQALLHANKGDIILLHGYLSNIKPVSSNTTATHQDIVHANFVQKFPKGYTQAINQIHCSALLTSKPKLMLTEQNKNITQATVVINQHIYDTYKQAWQTISVERAIHAWGKQAEYLAENGDIGDELMIEGRLSYTNGASKDQFIEAKNVHLFAST